MNKQTRQRAAELIEKHCPVGFTDDSVIDAIGEALNEFPPSAKCGSTNSKLGSGHWFNTIVSKHLHIGEFLKEKSPDEETIKEWGESLYITSKELIGWFEDLTQKPQPISPEECKCFDEAQGRNYCINRYIDTVRCVGTKCGRFERK